MSRSPGFTILDRDESFAADPQSLWMQTDIDAILNGVYNTGVRTGSQVTAQAIPDMTVAVATGTIVSGGTSRLTGAGNVNIGAADLTDPRVDCVVTDSAGVRQVRAGTAAEHPKAPEVTAGDVLLAMVLVPANAASIVTSYITDKRVFLPDHNSLANPAVGDAHGQYALLAGREDGQTLIGGTDAAATLTLQSTSNAIRGVIGLVDNAYAAGYLRVGSATAPTNVTAGDLTIGRLNVGNLAFHSTAQAAFIQRVGALNESYAGIWGWIENAPTADGGYWLRGIDINLVYDGAFTNSTVITGATFTVAVKGTGKPAFTSGVDAYGVWFRGGVGAPMSAGVVRGFATQMLTISGRTVETVHVDTLIGFQAEPGHSYLIAGDSVDDMYGFYSDALGHALVTNAYGMRLNLISGSPGVNVGIRLDGATTAALWLNTNTAANGVIAWGTARDTNLYRHATGPVLATDSNMRAAGYLRVGTVASAPANTTAGDLTATRLSLGNGALAAGQVLFSYNPSVANASATNAFIQANFTPTANGAYDMRGLEAQARYYGAFNNTSNLYGGVFSVSVGGTGKVNYLAAVFGTGLHLRTGAGAAMAVGDARAMSFQLVYGSGRAAGETATIDALTGVRIDHGYATLIAGDVVTNAYGVYMQNMGNAKVTNAYGIYIAGVSAAATLNIGIKLDGCTTAALWLNTDTPADGVIAWGTARDTNLYRSAANVLKTDDSLIVGIDFQHLGANLGLFGHAAAARDAAYTVANVTPDRTYDANATSVDELGDVLGTLIAYFISIGLLQ